MPLLLKVFLPFQLLQIYKVDIKVGKMEISNLEDHHHLLEIILINGDTLQLEPLVKEINPI
jgi:metal-responsive CopG/Arc/MetJ family transcriptional regulator